jgi:hypothetical protein
MSYRIDEKGKVFTTRVTKQSAAITARMGESIIYGMIHIAPDNRLKDELNNQEKFIAITQAQVWSVGGERPLYETDVLIVNKDHLDWIFPRNENPPNETPETP